MLDDDHYIPNARNAHLDTSRFEEDLYSQFTTWDGTESDLLESIYHRIFSVTNVRPVEPAEEALVCRYLSLDKFLQFLDTRHLGFPIATQFADHWECRVPEDYEEAVSRVLNRLRVSAPSWSSLVRLKAADWNISCWTELTEYYDDHLLWSAYAGGHQGVGITARYGILKGTLKECAGKKDRDGSIVCGRVNYDTISILPFNKHYMFRSENEVRFAFRAVQPGPTSLSVDKIFHQFGVRISPAATTSHRDKIARLWARYGGENRVQWPG